MGCALDASSPGCKGPGEDSPGTASTGAKFDYGIGAAVLAVGGDSAYQYLFGKDKDSTSDSSEGCCDTPKRRLSYIPPLLLNEKCESCGKTYKEPKASSSATSSGEEKVATAEEKVSTSTEAVPLLKVGDVVWGTGCHASGPPHAEYVVRTNQVEGAREVEVSQSVGSSKDHVEGQLGCQLVTLYLRDLTRVNPESHMGGDVPDTA